MNLLIIGGTRFLGRALVKSAEQRGHHLTLFNRGHSNPGLFPDVETLHGDRRQDLHLLGGRRWDDAIDTCGYEPGVVRASATALSDAVERYVFISSISVYASFREIGADETAPLAQLPTGVDPEAPFNIEYYGPLKVLCEQAAETALPGRTLNIRPGLIVGPWDNSDRFTYWPWRVARGGEVLAPDRPSYLTQFIDVRDLANWIIQMIEQHASGNYNATGPRIPLPMGDLLETCRTIGQSDAHFTWVPEKLLLQHGAQPWMELPLWIPDSDADSAGMNQSSIEKALAAGLTFRPLTDTVHDTLIWANSRPADHNWKAGLPHEKEVELLQKWHKERD